jgi:hypothetical protein
MAQLDSESFRTSKRLDGWDNYRDELKVVVTD